MALNNEEINKVNLLYKENDDLKAENARLRLIVDRLDKLEANMTVMLEKILDHSNQSHSHD